MEKTCDNCIYSNATPCCPPCYNWEECLENNRKFFEPNLFCKIKEKIKKTLDKSLQVCYNIIVPRENKKERK